MVVNYYIILFQVLFIPCYFYLFWKLCSNISNNYRKYDLTNIPRIIQDYFPPQPPSPISSLCSRAYLLYYLFIYPIIPFKLIRQIFSSTFQVPVEFPFHNYLNTCHKIYFKEVMVIFLSSSLISFGISQMFFSQWDNLIFVFIYFGLFSITILLPYFVIISYYIQLFHYLKFREINQLVDELVGVGVIYAKEMFAGRGKVEIFRSIIDSLRIARTSQNNNIIISPADTTTQIPLTGIIFLPHLHFIQKIIHITHAMALVFWIYPLLYFLQEGRCYCSLFLLLLSLPVLITTEYIFIQNFSLFVSIEKIHLQAIVAVLEENESNKKMLLQVKHTIRSYMKSLTLVNTATSTYTETNSALISQTPTPPPPPTTTTTTTPSHQEEEEEEEDKQEQAQEQEPEQQQQVQQQVQQQEQQQGQQEQEQVIGKDTIEGDTVTKEISIFQERLSHFKHPELSLPTFNTLLLLLNISVSDVLSKEIFYAIQNLYIESLTLQSLQDFLFKENDHLKTQQSDYAQLLLQVIAARQTSACSTSTQHQTYYNHQISLEYILSELATVDTSVELLNDLDQSFSSISSSSIVSCKNLSRNSSSNSRSTSSGSGSGSRSSNLSPPIIIPKLPIGIDNLIVEGNQSFSEINEIPPRQKTNKHHSHSHSHSHSPRINGEHKKQHTPRSKQSPRGQPTLTSPYYDPVSDSDDSAIPKPRPKTPKSHNDPLVTTTQVTSSSNTATTTNTATTISFEEISSIDNNLVTTAATTNTIPNIAKKSPRSSKNTSNEMKSRRTRSSNSKKGDTSLPQSFSGKTADSADIYSDLAVKRRKSLQGDPNDQPRRSHTTDEIGKVYDPWTFSDDDQTQRFVMTEPNDT